MAAKQSPGNGKKAGGANAEPKPETTAVELNSDMAKTNTDTASNGKDPLEELPGIVQEMKTQLRIAIVVFPLVGSIVAFFIGWLLYVPISEIYEHSKSIGSLEGKIDGVAELQTDLKKVAGEVGEAGKKLAKVEDYGKKFDQSHQDFLAAKASFETTEKSFKDATTDVNGLPKLVTDLKADLVASKKASDEAIQRTETLSKRLDVVTNKITAFESIASKQGTLIAIVLPADKPEKFGNELRFDFRNQLSKDRKYVSVELRSIALVWKDEPLPVMVSASVSEKDGDVQIVVTGPDEELDKLTEPLNGKHQPYFRLELMAR